MPMETSDKTDAHTSIIPEDLPLPDVPLSVAEEGDVVRGMVNGLISIKFLKRIQSLATKLLDQTVVLKLLGRHIGYNNLKSKSREDFLNTLADGPWTVFGHYLIVEPLIKDFWSSQPYSMKIVV
ncbi:hypothetical protein V6N11_065069 [Hibiscus sabdariffa]|uniref:DUF4283 domain-containing protein n=1 Tax=Hibiscus sabdariffa TaxID=183260 RepID=A0ABR2SIQ3_9ROSI